jgi:uncharacterized membrane protein
MENTRLSKHTVSFGMALALASVVNGLLVVAKEKSPAVLAGMRRLTGHHWITHSVLVLGLFALGGWVFARAGGGRGIKLTASRLIGILAAGVATGGLIILGFYLIGD